MKLNKLYINLITWLIYSPTAGIKIAFSHTRYSVCCMPRIDDAMMQWRYLTNQWSTVFSRHLLVAHLFSRSNLRWDGTRKVVRGTKFQVLLPNGKAALEIKPFLWSVQWKVKYLLDSKNGWPVFWCRWVLICWLNWTWPWLIFHCIHNLSGCKFLNVGSCRKQVVLVLMVAGQELQPSLQSQYKWLEHVWSGQCLHPLMLIWEKTGWYNETL